MSEPIRLDAISIIDVDTHYNEPLDLWTTRAPSKLRDRVPRVEKVNGSDQWVIERDTVLYPHPGVCVIRGDGSKAYGQMSLAEFDEMHPGATDPAARLAWMDEQGIFAQVIYPNLIGFLAENFLGQVSDPELSTFCIRAWNDYMGEVQEAGGGRLYPQALVPVWDVDLAVREVIRAHEELGMTGINVPSGVDAFGLPSLSHPSFDPLWAGRAGAGDVRQLPHRGRRRQHHAVGRGLRERPAGGDLGRDHLRERPLPREPDLQRPARSLSAAELRVRRERLQLDPVRPGAL